MARRWQQPFTVVPGLGCRAETPAKKHSHCSGPFSGSKEGTGRGRQSSMQGCAGRRAGWGFGGALQDKDRGTRQLESLHGASPSGHGWAVV